MRGRPSLRPDRSGNCVICGVWRQVLCRDRIVPGRLGGKYVPENIQWICANCHQDKTATEQSAAHKGRRKSPEQIEKMRAANKWRPVSDETREKIRLGNLAHYRRHPETALMHGKKMKALLAVTGAHNKGKPMSEEQKAKVSASLTEFYSTVPRKIPPWQEAGMSKTAWYRRLKRAAETPADTERRRAERRAQYHQNADQERENMRQRYRKRVAEQGVA